MFLFSHTLSFACSLVKFYNSLTKQPTFCNATFFTHKVTSKDQVQKFYIVVYWWCVVRWKICFNQSEITTSQSNVFVFKGILKDKQFQTNFIAFFPPTKWHLRIKCWNSTLLYWQRVVLLKTCFNQSEITTSQFNVFVFKGILEAKQFQTNFPKIMYCLQDLLSNVHRVNCYFLPLILCLAASWSSGMYKKGHHTWDSIEL